ncbi:MAG: SH3 domain-containing protein [Pseudomonadota bacterium]
MLQRRTGGVILLAIACILSNASVATSAQIYSVVFGNWAIEHNNGESLGYIEVFEVSVDAPGFDGKLFANAELFNSSALLTGSVVNKTTDAFIFDVLYRATASGENANGRLLLSLKGTDPDRLAGSFELDNRFVLINLVRQASRDQTTQNQSPQAIKNDPAKTALTLPSYGLRNIPSGRALRIRSAPNRSSQAIGQMESDTQNLSLLSCTPQIDPVRFGQVSFEGKLELLGGVWCRIKTRDGRQGFVLGRYLRPLYK